MMAGEFTVHVDPDGELIRVRGHGQASEETARRHFLELERAMADMRRRSGCARVLVDMGDGAVQTAEVAAIVHEETTRLYGEGDLVAILCHSMLQTLQTRRNGPEGRMRSFPADREAEAIAWLRGAPSAKDGDPHKASA
jgi:hypothetical protein